MDQGDDDTIEASVQVCNQHGLHARPAMLLSQLLSGERGNGLFRNVTIVRCGTANEAVRPVDGTSILGLLTLGATHGSNLTLRFEGAKRDQVDSVLEKVRRIVS